MTDSFFTILESVLVVIAFAAIVISIVLYVVKSIALYVMAKNKGIRHAWMGWIPLLDLFLTGEIVDDVIVAGKTEIPLVKWILPVTSVVIGVLNAFSSVEAVLWIGGILSILYAIYSYFVYFRIYKLYNPKHADLYLVLSIIFPIIIPILQFAIRKNEPVEYKIS